MYYVYYSVCYKGRNLKWGFIEKAKRGYKNLRLLIESVIDL